MTAPQNPDRGQKPRPRTIARQGKKVISGHFDVEVAIAMKVLAAQKSTTVQLLLARAINDFLEKNNLGRPADETPLPRGPTARDK